MQEIGACKVTGNYYMLLVKIKPDVKEIGACKRSLGIITCF